MNLSIQQHHRNFEGEPYVLPVARGMDLVLRSYDWRVTATFVRRGLGRVDGCHPAPHR